MKGLNEEMQSVTDELSRIERSRESAMACSRRVIRLSKNVIHAIHGRTDCSQKLDEMDGALKEMLDACIGTSVLSSGPVEDAMSEYAEARIFESVMRAGTIPSVDSVGVTVEAWVLGLADCIGEMRRSATTYLMEGDIEEAKRIFSMMEEINEELMLLDVPDAIVPIRRKQDIARGIMDKTRSEITTASIMKIRN